MYLRCLLAFLWPLAYNLNAKSFQISETDSVRWQLLVSVRSALIWLYEKQHLTAAGQCAVSGWYGFMKNSISSSLVASLILKEIFFWNFKHFWQFWSVCVCVCHNFVSRQAQKVWSFEKEPCGPPAGYLLSWIELHKGLLPTRAVCYPAAVTIPFFSDMMFCRYVCGSRRFEWTNCNDCLNLEEAGLRSLETSRATRSHNRITEHQDPQ